MNLIIHDSLTCNGNGVGAISGRGILRRKLTSEARIALAVDIALGKKPFIPSFKQMATAVGVSAYQLRQELKTRKRVAHNGAKPSTTKITNDSKFESTNGSAVTIPTTTAVLSDTPEVRVFLRRMAASLQVQIVQNEGDPEFAGDCGPYVLVDAVTGYCIWPGALPVAGLLDALQCLSAERRLPSERVEEAWADFGKSWKA
jgi:hypothetical protein